MPTETHNFNFNFSDQAETIKVRANLINASNEVIDSQIKEVTVPDLPNTDGYDATWMHKTRPPMARWVCQNYKMSTSTAEPIGVFAKAIAGIEKVEFYRQINVNNGGGQYDRTVSTLNEGAWELYATVDEETTRNIEGTDVLGYWIDYDATQHASLNKPEVRFYAKVYANAIPGRSEEENDARVLELRHGIFGDPPEAPVYEGDTRRVWWGELLMPGYKTSQYIPPKPLPYKDGHQAGGANVHTGSYIHVLRCYEKSGPTIYIDYENGSDIPLNVTGNKGANGTKEKPYKTITGGIRAHDTNLKYSTGRQDLSTYTVNLAPGDHYFMRVTGRHFPGNDGSWNPNEDGPRGWLSRYDGDFADFHGEENLIIQKDPDEDGEVRIVGCVKPNITITYDDNGDREEVLLTAEDIDTHHTVSAEGGEFFGYKRGPVEFKNVTFFNSDEIYDPPLYTEPSPEIDIDNTDTPLLDSIRGLYKRAKFLNQTQWDLFVYNNVIFDEGWDGLDNMGLAKPATIDGERRAALVPPSTSRFSATSGSTRGTFCFNTTIPRCLVPIGSTLTINEYAGECLEDFCGTGMGYKMKVDYLDNGRVSGFRSDSAKNFEVDLENGSGQVTDETTVLEGPLRYYDSNGNEKRGDFLHFELHYDGRAILKVQYDTPFPIKDVASGDISVSSGGPSLFNPNPSNSNLPQKSRFSPHQERHAYFGVANFYEVEVLQSNGQPYPDPQYTDETSDAKDPFAFQTMMAEMTYDENEVIENGMTGVATFTWDDDLNPIRAEKFEELKNILKEPDPLRNTIYKKIAFERYGTPHPDVIQYYGTAVPKGTPSKYRWPGGSDDDLERAERAPEYVEWLRSATGPHPTEFEETPRPRYQNGNNVCLYDVSAIGGENATQGLFDGGYGPQHNAYFGRVRINHRQTQNGYGRDNLNYNNHYVGDKEYNTLYDECEFTAGTFRGRRNSAFGEQAAGYAVDTVIRNCKWFDYSQADPEPSADRFTNFEGYNGEPRKSSAPLVGAYDGTPWYGGDAYPEVPGYPEIGYIAGNDGFRSFTALEGLGTFYARGAPAFPWHSKPEQIPLEDDRYAQELIKEHGPNGFVWPYSYGLGSGTVQGGSGYRYEGDFKGLPE